MGPERCEGVRAVQASISFQPPSELLRANSKPHLPGRTSKHHAINLAANQCATLKSIFNPPPRCVVDRKEDTLSSIQIPRIATKNTCCCCSKLMYAAVVVTSTCRDRHRLSPP
ncbi:unnamed protein product [Ectocarpus sp. 12 AP-2014]